MRRVAPVFSSNPHSVTTNTPLLPNADRHGDRIGADLGPRHSFRYGDPAMIISARQFPCRALGSALVLAVILAAPLVAADQPRVRPATWAQPVIGSSLDNFYQVSPDLYRSEQPGSDDMTMLATFGIRSVLNLREYHADDSKAAHTTLKLYRVAMNAGQVDVKSLAEALTILRQADKPILIHCWHGSDRTGLVVAMYRMVIQGWPREQAIDEFRHGGFGYHESTFPNILEFLKTVDLAGYRP
jgi:protein tyrosine phosphatase (PTP) superfamily phosphohydrolase (DUF442 family)